MVKRLYVLAYDRPISPTKTAIFYVLRAPTAESIQGTKSLERAKGFTLSEAKAKLNLLAESDEGWNILERVVTYSTKGIDIDQDEDRFSSKVFE